jgi:hypothetical protein
MRQGSSQEKVVEVTSETKKVAARSGARHEAPRGNNA